VTDALISWKKTAGEWEMFMEPAGEELAVLIPLEFGDKEGHPFRGNQWSGKAGFKLPPDEDPNTPGHQITVLHATESRNAGAIRKEGFNVMHGGGLGQVLGKGGYGSLQTPSGDETQENLLQDGDTEQLALRVTLKNPLILDGEKLLGFDKEVEVPPGMTPNAVWRASIASTIARDVMGVPEAEWDQKRATALSTLNKQNPLDYISSSTLEGLALRGAALDRGIDSIVWHGKESVTEWDPFLGDQVVVFNSDQVQVLDDNLNVIAAGEKKPTLIGLVPFLEALEAATPKS
jgi:hypothetical protein